MDTFESNRDRAIELVEMDYVSAETMMIMALKWLSEDEVADMLDANELSDRFLNEEVE